MPMLKMLEKDLQKLIIGWLECQGCQVVKNHTTGIPDKKAKGGYRRNHNKGLCDLSARIPPHGKTFDIEVKLPGKKASPEQLEFLEASKIAGCLTLVAHSLEEVQEVFNGYKYSK